MSRESAHSLLDAARSGDRSALQELLCKHFDRLLSHISYRVGTGTPELSPEDLLQETFVHAVRDISKCQANSEVAFFAWLKSISDNRLRDALKQAATKKRGGDRQQVRAVRMVDASTLMPLVEVLSESLKTPSMDAASFEVVTALQVALTTLPDDQREAITLRHIEGRELAEVAELLGKTSDAVRGLIHRGKQALAEAMGNSSRWFGKKQ